jgi:hypothetical protein
MLAYSVGELRVKAAMAGAAIGLALATASAHAGDPPASTPAESIVAPPPSDHAFVQYGVALAAEIVAFAGPACSDPGNPCILGSGGGIVARAGWRRNETFYVGGAYEMSKQEPHQLYRLALLQQVRAEVRRYFPTGREISPFVLLAGGIGTYGNEWFPIDTWGPSATLGGGLEVQLGGSVLSVSLAYRPIYFRAWEDSSLLSHDAGIAHFVGLEAAVEAQDAL